MKQLILVLFAATFSLSVTAGKPTKEQIIDPVTAPQTSERGKPSKDQITEASCKFAIDQKGTKFTIDEAGVKRQATEQHQKECAEKYGKGVVMQKSSN